MIYSLPSRWASERLPVSSYEAGLNIAVDSFIGLLTLYTGMGLELAAAMAVSVELYRSLPHYFPSGCAILHPPTPTPAPAAVHSAL